MTDRERDRERERERDRKREGDRETERDREKETERKRQRPRALPISKSTHFGRYLGGEIISLCVYTYEWENVLASNTRHQEEDSPWSCSRVAG